MGPSFLIREARPSDTDGIMAVMETARDTVACRDWFMADERPFVEAHIRPCEAEEPASLSAFCQAAGRGRTAAQDFCLTAETERGQIAAFLIVHIPGEDPENLGRDLGWPEETLLSAVHMESAAVLPAFRGHGLEGQLLQEAEQMLAGTGVEAFLATVHPDNLASLRTFQKLGYEIGATKEKYGGKLRHILWKKKAVI